MMLGNTHKHTTFSLSLSPFSFSPFFSALSVPSPSFPSPSWHSSLPLLPLRTKSSLSFLFFYCSCYPMHLFTSICHLSSSSFFFFFHPSIFLSFLFILYLAPLPPPYCSRGSIEVNLPYATSLSSQSFDARTYPFGSATWAYIYIYWPQSIHSRLLAYIMQARLRSVYRLNQSSYT